MAYITSEQVKEKRKLLKMEFPSSKGWKFSVTKKDDECICVYILESPHNLGEFNSVDIHNIESRYKNNIEARNDLLKIKEIINKGNYNNYDITKKCFDPDVSFFSNDPEKCMESTRNSLLKVKQSLGKEYLSDSDAIKECFAMGFYVYVRIGKLNIPHVWNKQSIRKDV